MLLQKINPDLSTFNKTSVHYGGRQKSASHWIEVLKLSYFQFPFKLEYTAKAFHLF